MTERKQAEEGLLRRTRELEAMLAIANALAGPESFEVKARKMLVEMKTLGSADMASLLPLKVGQMTLGTVSLSAGDLDHFTPERMQLLTAVASQLGILVENARLREQTEHRLVQIQVAHEQLQRLSQRLLEVQEMERRHLSQELHDEIGRQLTALQLLLDAAERSPADAVAGKLHHMRGLIQELMDQVRHLSLDLRPPMLDDLGLLPTVLWHIKRYTTQSQVLVDCTHAGVEGRRFPPDLETAAFRIVQEALTNMARHAQAKQASVRLWTTSATLGVQIEDQGVGFDRQVSSVGHLGLAGMQERTRFLGGRFTLETAPGTGTRITAEWSLPQQDER
jgi:signal transduction histidine kinase